MNFFFGISHKFFKSTLTIPKFQNNGFKSKNYYPCEAFIKNQNWCYKKSIFTENDDFFFIKKDQINNEKIFFLSNNSELTNNNYTQQELRSLNNFTKTKPTAYRSNLRVDYNNKGFSSYQSEYPFEMVKKRGNILSPVSTLLNIEADQNYIFLRNIFFLPIKEKFKIFFFNIETKKIEDTFEIFTNESNLIEVNKKNINDNTYIFSDGFLVIPIFISVKNNHLSMEHTHPPHHYILSDDKFKTVTKLKNEIKSQIFK